MLRKALGTLALSLSVLTAMCLAAIPAVAGVQIHSADAVIVHTHGQDIAVDPVTRHGVVHTPQWLSNHHVSKRAFGGPLPYQGGPITAGAPRVYLVFWGSQWGTASTGGDGYQHYSGDTAGIAPRAQAFFAGLGTNGELWDGVTTQYCQGVSVGATSCPSNTTHVGYPTGGALAGVWNDNSSPSPSTSTASQIAAESVLAAGHFGNTTSNANKDSQYVIISPKGTNPDSYKSQGFCAWHDSTTSVNGQISYTNLPYITDAGSSCYGNSVNSGSAGTLDGVTVVGGHEYSETITDPFPTNTQTAWWDPTDSTSGGENADKCSIGLGFAGANLSLATGTFAVQPTYDNDAHACTLSHAIVGGGGGGGTQTLTVSKAGTGTGTITSSPSGINCGSTCSQAFSTGTQVTLTESPGTGSSFSGWSGGGCSGASSQCAVTMNSATSVTATFSTSGGGSSSLVVSRSGTGTGTVTSSPSGINCGSACSASFVSGTGVTLTASADSGSTFTGWSGDCSGTGSCAVTMNSSHSVTASFDTSSSTDVTVTGALSGGYATSGSYTYFHQYRPVTFKGSTSPNLAGHTLKFEMYRWNGYNWLYKGQWSYPLSSVSTATIRFGSYSLSRTYYAIRAFYSGDSSHSEATSDWYYLRVTY